MRERLRTAVDGSTLDESYAYDNMGRRLLVDADGTQTVYVYDGAQMIAEYSLVSQTLTLKKRFIYGPGIDEPVCMITYSGGSESGRYFYHYDGQGNVIALSNSSGDVVEEYEYDVYGSVLVDGTYNRSQVGNPYLFTGRRWDSTTELYYYRMRNIQPDLAGYIDGMNLYAYCGNNPLNWIDPWGLDKLNTGSLNPPEGFPKPPGWTPDWEWIPTDDPRGGGEWKDPGGGTWRPHPDPGGEHGGDHYDYTPPGRRGRKYRKKIGSDGSEIAKKITLGAYIVGGSLILDDIMLGGPTGEGIVPALIIIGW